MVPTPARAIHRDRNHPYLVKVTTMIRFRPDLPAARHSSSSNRFNYLQQEPEETVTRSLVALGPMKDPKLRRQCGHHYLLRMILVELVHPLVLGESVVL